MSFEFAYARTADFERGWANDPNDPGGKTMHGVTEATWRDYWRRRGTAPPCRIEEATAGQTKIVLKDDYWTRPKCDQVAIYGSKMIAARLFDSCVHHGQVRGVKLLQQALNYVGADLVTDGIIGPKTLAAVEYYSKNYHDALQAAMSFERAKYMDGIFKRTPSQRTYVRGWFKRLI